MQIEPDTEDGWANFSLLAYTADDRWMVLGEQTQSAALVLAVMLGFTGESVVGEA